METMFKEDTPREKNYTTTTITMFLFCCLQQSKNSGNTNLTKSTFYHEFLHVVEVTFNVTPKIHYSSKTNASISQDLAPRP